MREANLRLDRSYDKSLAHFAPWIMGGVILITVPLFLPSYLQSTVIRVLIFAIFAMSLDILWGYTGLISLGHAAYFGIGSYTVGILTQHYSIDSFWIIAPLAVFMSMLTAAIFGIIALRMRGMYFLMITFALGELLYSIAVEWYSLTGGYYGLTGIPRPNLSLPGFRWNNTSFYYFILLFFVICFYILNKFVHSPFGLTLKGIRENESRMQIMGYNTWLHKYIAFIVSGAFAGIAGMLFAYHNRLITPAHFGIVTSTSVMLMVILGGVGTLYGPVIGAGVFIFTEYFTGIYFPKRWPLILGSLFVVVVMFARSGVGVMISKFGKELLSRWKF